MKERSRRGIRLLLVLLLLGSGGWLLWQELDRVQGRRDYEQAVQIAGAAPATSAPVSDELWDPWVEVLAQVDLAGLREVNSDVIAWIMIPGTDLSYPVLQGGDNSFYLNHTWTGERSAVGAVFMECECVPDFSGFNTIVYGHRMNDESMFGILHGYQEKAFQEEHPDIYVADESAVRRYEVFAAHEVGVREIVYRLDIEEKGLEQEFIDFCLERSQIDAGAVPAAEDQVITLSTCMARGHATRWVVQAVLREELAR